MPDIATAGAPRIAVPRGGTLRKQQLFEGTEIACDRSLPGARCLVQDVQDRSRRQHPLRLSFITDKVPGCLEGCGTGGVHSGELAQVGAATGVAAAHRQGGTLVFGARKRMHGAEKCQASGCLNSAGFRRIFRCSG